MGWGGIKGCARKRAEGMRRKHKPPRDCGGRAGLPAAPRPPQPPGTLPGPPPPSPAPPAAAARPRGSHPRRSRLAPCALPPSFSPSPPLHMVSPLLLLPCSPLHVVSVPLPAPCSPGERFPAAAGTGPCTVAAPEGCLRGSAELMGGGRGQLGRAGGQQRALGARRGAGQSSRPESFPACGRGAPRS